MTITVRSLFFSLLLVGASGLGIISDDPMAFCEADGNRFTCSLLLALTALDRPTGAKFESTITCDLDRVRTEKHAKSEAFMDFLNMDFSTADNCVCQAHFAATGNTDGSDHDTDRDCTCSVCPKGSLEPVSLDCRGTVENPAIIFGECAFVDCEGRCNGEGPPVFGNVVIVPPSADDDLEETSYGSSSPPGNTSATQETGALSASNPSNASSPPGPTSNIQETGALSSSNASTSNASADSSSSASSLVMMIIIIVGGILLILFAVLICFKLLSSPKAKASAVTENSKDLNNDVLEEGTMASEVSLEMK